MKLDDLLNERKKLSAQINKAVFSLVEDFKIKTGISPNSIGIHLINITEIGDKKERYVVCDTTVSLEIENI